MVVSWIFGSAECHATSKGAELSYDLYYSISFWLWILSAFFWEYPCSVDIICILWIYPYFMDIIRILWKYPLSVDIIHIIWKYPRSVDIIRIWRIYPHFVDIIHILWILSTLVTLQTT